MTFSGSWISTTMSIHIRHVLKKYLDSMTGLKKKAPKITSITRIAKAPHDAFLSRSNTESNEINARYTLSPGVELKSPAMITEGLQLNLFEMSCSN